jgi:hypothetical protein
MTMKEMDARLAIMAVEELTAAQKLIMLYILTRVDWQSWSGSVSTNDIEQGTRQSARNIKRSLKALADLGYIERDIKRRDDGLHHKASIKVCLSQLGDRKSPPMVTESHHQASKGSDRKSPPMVTESHHTEAEGSDRKSPPMVTNWHEGSDRKSPWVVTNWPKGGDRKSPNNNKDQYNININQYNINSDEAELSSAPVREAEVELDAEEQARADLWDQLMPEPEPITEELIGSIWVVSRIDDDLAYKREIMRQIEHHERWDIKRALWNRQEGDQLFAQMKADLIAPRSAIDWVTTQAAGHPPAISTPAAPAPKPKTYTVTLSDVERRRQIDKAWAEGWDQ